MVHQAAALISDSAS